MKITKFTISETECQYFFMCPACNETHAFNQTWEFNGDYELPTISPSLLVTGYGFDGNKNSVPIICHSWITKGKIKFFKDCSHDKAGTQWHDLLEINTTKN